MVQAGEPNRDRHLAFFDRCLRPLADAHPGRSDGLLEDSATALAQEAHPIAIVAARFRRAGVQGGRMRHRAAFLAAIVATVVVACGGGGGTPAPAEEAAKSLLQMDLVPSNNPGSVLSNSQAAPPVIRMPTAIPRRRVMRIRPFMPEPVQFRLIDLSLQRLKNFATASVRVRTWSYS